MSQFERDAQEFFGFLLQQDYNVQRLIASYLDYHGTLNAGHRRRYYETLKTAFVRSGDGRSEGLEIGDVFAAEGNLRESFLMKYAPAFSGFYFAPTDRGLTYQQVFGASVNSSRSVSLPRPYAMNIRKEIRPALKIIQITEGALFLSPYGYQHFNVESGEYWPDLSSRSFAKSISLYPKKQVDAFVVIVQDQFNSTNLCHFLYDSIPRVICFAETFPEMLPQVIFVFGGEKGPYQEMFADLLSSVLGLRAEQLVWLQARELWTSSKAMFFFSDQKISPMHPMHMCRPETLSRLKHLGSLIQMHEGSPPKVYISRNDTRMRRLRNEEELVRMLEASGYVSLSLSGMTAMEQISVVSQAASIVAPHGMGLTNIVFSNHLRRLVEIFHPVIGSDSYAFPATAMNVDYRFVIGSNNLVSGNSSYVADLDSILDRAN